jgi:hypothetical protein
VKPSSTLAELLVFLIVTLNLTFALKVANLKKLVEGVEVKATRCKKELLNLLVVVIIDTSFENYIKMCVGEWEEIMGLVS